MEELGQIVRSVTLQSVQAVLSAAEGNPLARQGEPQGRAQDAGANQRPGAPAEPAYSCVYGPYLNRGRYHVHLHLLDGTRRYRSFRDACVAAEFTEGARRRTVSSPITVAGAVAEYIATRVDLKESSRETMRFRLAGLVRGHEDARLASFPAEQAWQQAGASWAVDTLHGLRSAANAFLAWAVQRGYIPRNPLGDVRIAGRKKRGKPQLRIDEARRLLERALAGEAGRQGDRLDPVALAAVATALLMGLRSSEIVSLRVRDLDDGGTVLWIQVSKTAAGVRSLAIPEVLRPRLSQLAADRAPTEALFPALTRDKLRSQCRKTCRLLGLPVVTPHGLRGTHATASFRPHTNPHEVAAALGHASPAVTFRHYARPAAVEAARVGAATATLVGPAPTGRQDP